MKFEVLVDAAADLEHEGQIGCDIGPKMAERSGNECINLRLIINTIYIHWIEVEQMLIY
jgi:hypothetical protein